MCNHTSYCFVASIAFLLASLDLLYARHILHASHSAACSESLNVCLTPSCIRAANNVLNSLDEMVDPCDDFYKFACGGFVSKRTIPKHKTYVDVTRDISEDLDLKLKELLEKQLDTHQPSFIKMAKDFHDSCMDLESIEKMGSQPLKRILDYFGGWPVVEGSQWNESSFDWVDSLILMRELGYDHSILLLILVLPDTRNITRHVITLDQASLGLPDRSYYLHGLNNSVAAAYFKKMVQSAKLLGAEEFTAERELLKAMEFEISLAKFSTPEEERTDLNKLYNKFTVGDLKYFSSQIPWLRYLNGLFSDAISENETVIVNAPDFLQKFADLITSTDKRVIANYMIWRVVSESMEYLSKEWRDIVHEYNLAVVGKEESPRWEKCLQLTIVEMGIALSSYYVRKYFKEEDKEAALSIVKYVHKEFLNILEDIEWMDEKTKEEAKSKAKAIRSYIGYPKELLNDTAVTAYYEGVKITNESYFDNIMTFNKRLMDDFFSKLRKPVIKGEWHDYGMAAMVNALYNFQENSMYFPAGILQDAFFERDRPNYLNFGGIGWIVGHELTHGFDDRGKQIDKDGNERNWWDKSTNEQYTLKAQCIVDQYSNYTAENGMNINGILTLGENIADIGGLKEAYRAYLSWTKDNEIEQLLPGVNYTQNQLFWINAAYQWCTKYQPEVLKFYIISDVHSIAPFRVIGSMSNLPEFSEDFNCPADSPMNRKNKCEVW